MTATSRKKARGPQRQPPRQERSRATVSVIEQAIDDVVARVGLSGLTAASVAARAGVGPGTLYRYFGSRDEMLASWERRARRRCWKELARATDAHERLDGVVREVARRTIRAALDASCLARQDLFGPVLAHPDREERRRFADRTVALVIRFLRRHGDEDLAPDVVLAARVCVYAVLFTAHPIALDGSSADAREAFASVSAEMVTRTLVRRASKPEGCRMPP